MNQSYFFFLRTLVQGMNQSLVVNKKKKRSTAIKIKTADGNVVIFLFGGSFSHFVCIGSRTFLTLCKN